MLRDGAIELMRWDSAKCRPCINEIKARPSFGDDFVNGFQKFLDDTCSEITE